jgi:hypothetical protein
VFLVGLVYGQNRKISGKVMEKVGGSSLPGASVVILETGNSTSTNSEGMFSIDAETGQSLKVSFIGMKTDTVKIGTNTNNLIMLLKLIWQKPYCTRLMFRMKITM